MMSCLECLDDVPKERAELGFGVCISCQEDLEKEGKFVKHRMEIYQELVGWQCESVKTQIIRGG